MSENPGPILIVMHGMPPRDGAPVSGMGLRAWTLGEGLVEHGLEVIYATRRGDVDEPADAGDGSAARPLTFHHDELAARIDEVDPAVIVVVATDEATRLPASTVPIVLDLFAPRLLERQYQGIDDPGEATRLLEAMGRADRFLFSNRRQRDYFLGQLTVAGVDCRELPGDVVPLAAVAGAPRHVWPEEPVLVSGGVFWPWIDARAALTAVVDQLERRGRGVLRLFGGPYVVGGGDDGALRDPTMGLPASERLRFEGFVPYAQLLREYARATAAVDLAAANPERELSFAFRHVDYLRCGLPMLLSAHTAAAAELAPAGAAIAVEVDDERAVRAAVDRVLDDPDAMRSMGAVARRLARTRHGSAQATAPLAAFCRRPRHRERADTLLVRAAAERNRLADELELAVNRRTLIERRLEDAERRVERADRERELAWTHFRESAALLEDAWERQRQVEEARDRAWQAHARATADTERALAQRDRAWSTHDATERALRQARQAGDAAWRAHDERAAELRERTAERDRRAAAERSAVEARRQAEAERDRAREQLVQLRMDFDRAEGDLRGARDALGKALADRGRLEAELRGEIARLDDDRRRLERLLHETVGWRAKRGVDRLLGREES